jgi:hypothetical protein
MRKFEYAALSFFLISSPAFAGLSIGLNIGIPAPAPVIVEQPAPVVVEQPAPVVVAPAPVVEEPAPVVIQPAPVVVAPAPVVVAPAPALCSAISFGAGGAALYAASCMDPYAYNDPATLQLLAGCRYVGPNGLVYYTQDCVNRLNFTDGGFWAHAGYLHDHYAHMPPRPGFDPHGPGFGPGPHDPGFGRGGGRGFPHAQLDDLNDQLAQMNGAILDPSLRQQADLNRKPAVDPNSSPALIQTASAGDANSI